MKLRAAALLLGASVALGACNVAPQSDQRWVSNSKERMFTRIPKSWKTFVIDPYKVDLTRPKGLKRSTSRWSLILDSQRSANLKGSRARLDENLPKTLVGEMSVRPLPSDWATGDPSTSREGVSVSSLRAFAFNETKAGASVGDPVKQFLDGTPSIEMIVNQEPARKDGLRGSHIRFNYEVRPNSWVTIDQQVLVDRTTSKIYRLVLKCESTCFKRSYNEAKRISASWTVKK